MSQTTTALDPIVIKGNQFVYKSTGARFLARGVILIGQSQSLDNGAAPQDPDSALLWEGLCTKEIKGFLALGVNVVMVIIADTSQDRSSCINQLSDAGIYLLVVLFREHVDSTSDAYAYQTAAIDSLSPYSNILGFALLLDTEEPNIDPIDSEPLTFIKAQIRDIKDYITTSNYRDIPIGIFAYWDTSSSNGTISTEYLRCGNLSDGMIEFYLPAICMNGSMQNNPTALQHPTTALQDFEMPLILLNDHSCDVSSFSTSSPDYTWTTSLFTPPLSSVWSGAIFDYWFQREYGTGLVNITEDEGLLFIDESIAYSALHTQVDLITAKITPTSVYSPTWKISSCPTIDAGFRASTKLPPRPNPQLCRCMMSSLSCVVPEAIPAVAVSDLLEKVCLEDLTSCIGVSKNGTSAVYGAYSGCNMYQQYSWALNRLAITRSSNGKPTNCSFSTWERSQSPSISPTCSSMLLQAGVLGDGTVKLQTTSPTSSSRSSVFIGNPGNSGNWGSEGSELSTGGIVGVVVGIVVLTCIIIGSILLWHRKKHPKSSLSHNPSAEGLEVGEAPAGIGHHAELGGEDRRSEMWTKGNTSELPTSVPLQELSDGITMPKQSTPRSLGRGEYAAVPRVDIEVEELDGMSRVEGDVVAGKGIRRKPLALEIAPSWAGAAWFDPNDPRQVLPGDDTVSRGE
ncbi:1,3-beta-glucanosyltransferase gas1 [Cadophora gregata]|uniref:1,3-beta-glucanosyltransferase gas1 n=1 Tax=Cadophora gregata TaxID=51156 RepID=UPI0026DCCCA4|nr:1,3-beta-glucanosyltransferase gas1 [Cadophora gregata]KAK0117670.1 1,3-beta-glucanosyltransferase gas1 [Cadophora gregata]KAK0122719.1 1,3-beta-glucanosyltransferase gas1 [Cadophora gregata f. sp. sojae]